MLWKVICTSFLLFQIAVNKKDYEQNVLLPLLSHACSIILASEILLVSLAFLYKGHALEGMWIALSIAGVIGIFIIKRYMTGKPDQNN